MRYIVLNGEMYAGKSTVTQKLEEILPDAVSYETGQVIAEVADEMHAELNYGSSYNLKDMYGVRDWIGCLPGAIKTVTGEKVDRQLLELEVHTDTSRLREYIQSLAKKPAIAEEKITPENKETYRPFLQWIGGFVAKQISGSFWFDEIIKRSELDAESGAKFSVLNAVRFKAEEDAVRQVGGHIIKVIRSSQRNETTELTEKEVSLIDPDTTIYNDASVQKLQLAANEFAFDFMLGVQDKTYHASTM